MGSTPQLAAITILGSACSIRVLNSLAAKPKKFSKQLTNEIALYTWYKWVDIDSSKKTFNEPVLRIYKVHERERLAVSITNVSLTN